jgi:hypothetical protein
MLCAVAYGNVADAPAPTAWATGPAFRQTLAQPVDIFWSSIPLRRAMTSLSQAQHVAIVIDRRVDPSRKLDVEVKNVSLESALRLVADRCGLGVGRLGDVIYLGPVSAAERLHPVATLLEKELRQLPAAAQRKFLHAKAIAWRDLSTPRDLLAQLGQENGVEIIGLGRVPHDLWAAADLPPLSLIDRLTIIVVQFDLAFQFSDAGARIVLVPIPANLPRAAAAQVRVAASPHKPKRPMVQPSDSLERLRITRLSVQAEPLGPVLRQLAERLGLELNIAEKAIQAAGVSLDQRVSVKVENATIDELFRQLLHSTGLTFHRRQKVVEIVPAESAK